MNVKARMIPLHWLLLLDVFHLTWCSFLQLDEHMESACTKQGIPCPFSECGCEFRCARKEMNKHIRDEPVKHLTLVGQTILAHKKTLEMHSEIMDSQNDKLGMSRL